jgi:molecular chaperone GrpE
LHTLLGQFVALRHEINLQTKAARGQQEQTAEALSKLGEALEAIQEAENKVQESDKQEESELLRPLIKTLVDATDVLGLAQREVQRGRDAVASLLAEFDQPTETEPAVEETPRPSFWARWFGGSRPGTEVAPSIRVAKPGTRQATERIRQFVESLVTGYTMSLQRLQRTLAQCGLEPIPCKGQAFDPELMEVVEAVTNTGLPAGEVLDEVRRGYFWRGRVFRYAQVRVARS